MSFTAKIEADIKNWSGNLDQAERESKSFANSVASDVNKINRSFDKINGNSIGGLNNRLTALKKNLESATDIQSISKYNIRIKQTQDEIERLRNLGLQASVATKNIGASSAVGGIDKMTSAMRRSNTVSMEFNRIIQDAPFGMMGISNNLTQLSDNYKNYAAQVRAAAAEQGKSISNFQIFKGAIAGIFSPLNLFSLGLAAVTSGMIVYQRWQQQAAKRTKETTDKLQELVDGLGNVSTAMYKGAQSSGQEVAQLNTLYAISNDVTQSTEARTKAANDLIKQYPALFGKFNTEQVMLGKAKKAYDEVSKSILAAARAQAAYGMIGEKSAQQLAIDETNREIQKQISLLDGAIQRQESLTSAGQSVGAGAESAESGNIRRLNDLYDERSKLVKQVTDNLLQRATVQEQINELESFAIGNQAKVINLDNEQAKGSQKKTKSLSEYRNELVETLASWGIYEAKMESLNTKFGDMAVLAKNAGASLAELQTIAARQWVEAATVQFEKLGDTITKSLGVTGLSQGITIPVSLDISQETIDKFNGKLKTTATDLGGTFVIEWNSIIAKGITSVAGSIGEALATGQGLFKTIGDNLLRDLGGLAKSIGEQMIAFGTAGIALKNLMLNPFLAVAAGAALVALGSFAQSSVSRQTSQFNGSNASASYGSQINSDYSQWRGAYYNNDRQKVEFEISGNKLKGVLNINDTRDKRLG